MARVVRCPACGEGLRISRLACEGCGTKIEGDFEGCPFCVLDPEEAEFLFTFVKVGGAIKDMEKELGISYPTVKNRLAKIQERLGLRAADAPAAEAVDRVRVLERLQKGEITYEEAMELLG